MHFHSSTYHWFVQIDNTPFKGAEIIRLKRSKLWDRYKSLLKAQETAVWHARDADQVEGKETMLTVPVEKMIDDVMWMKRVDDEADEWARTHASEVIFVDYEECKASPESCHTNMLEFLCVESNGQAETGSRLLLPREVTPFKPLKTEKKWPKHSVLMVSPTTLNFSCSFMKPSHSRHHPARHVRRANE